MSYSVRYRPLGSEDPQPKEVNGIPPTTTQILLEALDKWTEYRITTVAHTEVGPGPESSPVVIRTDEDGKHRPRLGTPAGPARPLRRGASCLEAGLAGGQEIEATAVRGRREASSHPEKPWAPGLGILCSRPLGSLGLVPCAWKVELAPPPLGPVVETMAPKCKK